MTQASSSQWDCLLRNLGAWQGSFARLSPHGVLEEEIPSLVTLEGLHNNQTVHQTVQHFSAAGDRIYNKELEYSTLNRSTLFFETGAFSQGSLQFGPFSEFGAELGFIAGDRRLRLVQLFNTASQLDRFTLIREHRQGTPAAARPPLTVEQLLGDWQGEAITLYPDWRTPDRYATTLSIRREGDRLIQQLTAPQLALTSTATIDGSTLRFEQSHPIQVLLLPDGASANTPLVIPKGQPFLLEAGWLLADNLRQRMIRRYDAQGGWSSLTLVTEKRA
ncbi:DUF3598 family protein [Phormidium tenue FACHB-886]|nr:DUF3598 family protein [Phormidium tenue FACHB-886]